MTQIIEDEYTRKYMPDYIGVELIPKFWHATDEDAIWCECPTNPLLSGYHFYASLRDWKIYDPRPDQSYGTVHIDSVNFEEFAKLIATLVRTEMLPLAKANTIVSNDAGCFGDLQAYDRFESGLNY